MSGSGADRLRELRAALEAEMRRVVERAESEPPRWLPAGESAGSPGEETGARGVTDEPDGSCGRGDEEYYNPRSWLV